MKSPTARARPTDWLAMVSAVAAEPVSLNVAGLVYWFCVPPDPGVLIQTMAVVAGVWSMLPLAPPGAMEPVLMAVWAVAPALMAGGKQPQQLPNNPARIACSENWAKGMVPTFSSILGGAISSHSWRSWPAASPSSTPWGC